MRSEVSRISAWGTAGLYLSLRLSPLDRLTGMGVPGLLPDPWGRKCQENQWTASALLSPGNGSLERSSHRQGPSMEQTSQPGRDAEEGPRQILLAASTPKNRQHAACSCSGQPGEAPRSSWRFNLPVLPGRPLRRSRWHQVTHQPGNEPYRFRRRKAVPQFVSGQRRTDALCRHVRLLGQR